MRLFVLGDERCGGLDPLDTTRPGVKGRGTRITIRGENERLLADIIIGTPVEGHPGFRYVRLPDQRRIYISRVGELMTSTDFGDWIERDVLQVNRNDIDAINIRNYSLDESTRRVTPRELLVLRKKAPDQWTIDNMNPGEEVDATQINLMITNLVELKIVGVLPKPPGISATLSNATNAAVTWTLTPATGAGTISTTGLYTAPATIAATQTVTVTAQSQADTTQTATATITLQIAMTVSPGTVTLSSSQTQQFSATIAGSPSTSPARAASPSRRARRP